MFFFYVIHFCDGKDKFWVSHDASVIILIWWFVAQETLFLYKPCFFSRIHDEQKVQKNTKVSLISFSMLNYK